MNRYSNCQLIFIICQFFFLKSHLSISRWKFILTKQRVRYQLSRSCIFCYSLWMSLIIFKNSYLMILLFLLVCFSEYWRTQDGLIDHEKNNSSPQIALLDRWSVYEVHRWRPTVRKQSLGPVCEVDVNGNNQRSSHQRCSI